MMKLKHNLPSTPPTQSGFTIIESLMAILVVSFLMAAISPVIVLSVATRVQARRVELATEAARTYIDGVRAGTITQPNSIAPVEKTNAAAPVVKAFNFSPAVLAQVPALQGPPATTLNCQPPQNPGEPVPKGFYCPGYNPPTPSLAIPSLYCINLDGTGCVSGSRSRNLVVQAFRSVTPKYDQTGSSLIPDDLSGNTGYLLGVRVYRLDAFDGTNLSLKTMAETGGKKVSTFTGGLGTRTGDRQAPLMELTTEIRPAGSSSEPSSAYKGLCDRLGGCE